MTMNELRTLSATLVVAACAALFCDQTLAAESGPNVVIILGDDQCWTDYGFMGHPTLHTPHLDRLASEGLVFTRGYVPTSLCRASLASLSTGLYPQQHRITSNDPPALKATGKKKGAGWGTPEGLAAREAMVRIFEQSPTIPKLLAAKGYASFQSGKWWEGNFSRGSFTAGMTHGDPRRGGRHGDEGLKIGRQTMQPVFDFLDGVGEKRFFLWYAPMMPHQPHNPPERLLAKYKDKTDSIHVARYWAMCEWFDETVGQLLERLEQRGLAKNTLVVYLHDNGWVQNPAGPNGIRAKLSPYDDGTRTPIVLRWPGRITPRRDEQSLAQSIDLAPTILAACGLAPTSDMRGLNLLDAAALAQRKSVCGAIFLHNAIDVERPDANVLYRWGLAGDWKLILPDAQNASDKKIELYNLRSDPREHNEVSAQHPDRVEQLHKLIDAWWTPRR